MMRARIATVLVVGILFCSIGAAFAGSPDSSNTKKPLFDTSMFRPRIVLHDVPVVTDESYTTISGIVFSRSPLDRVVVGERVALIRPAEPADLVKLRKLPEGASDAPFRVFFEVPDAGLAKLGANDLSIMAVTNDGRKSDQHRVTVIRTAPAGESEQ